MISSLCWVPQGASKSKPLRYEISRRELEELMQAQGIAADDDDAEGHKGNNDKEVDRSKDGDAEAGDANELPAELRMDDYDDEPGLTVTGNDNDVDDIEGDAMDEDEDSDDDDDDEADGIDDESQEDVHSITGIGVSFAEEPGARQVFAYESEEDSDAEDNVIKPTDHVLLTANTEEDEHSSLEVQVYSAETGNLYVHHDIALPALPLSLAWMDMPPRTATMSRVSGSADEGHTVGSYCAVGTFEPAIEIWNLDVLDPLEPSASLGGYREKEKKAGKKARKRPLLPGSHSDGVLSLSWNREHRHVLASGSADNSVKVWDVTTQQCSATLTHHRDKVQGVCWHPVEATVMASMGYDRALALLDARAPSKVTSHNLNSDPECLLWNPHNPSQILTGSEDGVVCCRDVRRPDSPVYSFTAHETGVSAISLTPLVPGMLATCSEDKTVRVWDIDVETPLQVASKSMAVGRLFSLEYDTSSPFLLATAGSKGHVALWHSDDDEAISSRFSSRVGTGVRAAGSVGQAKEKDAGAIGDILSGGNVDEGKETTTPEGGASSSHRRETKKKKKRTKASA